MFEFIHNIFVVPNFIKTPCPIKQFKKYKYICRIISFYERKTALSLKLIKKNNLSNFSGLNI